MDNEVISAVETEVSTEAQGVGEQEITEPAADPETAGAEEQEITEPAEPSAEETSKTQTPEERHAQAEKRRRRERQEFEDKLNREYEEKFQKQKDNFYAGMKKVNPYTNEPITNEAEFIAYEAETRRREREQEFKKAGLKPETIEQMINEHPDVKAAKEAAEEAKASKERYDKLAAQQVVMDEIRKIRQIDPNIRTAEDLMKHPKYAEIKQLVTGNNHTLAKAFEIATKESREAQVQARGRDSAAAVASSKGHMVSSAVSGTGADEFTVPAETLKYYRKAYPKLSDAELRKKYAEIQRIKKGS